MKKLEIAPDLSLPLRFLERRTVTYGTSGAGKTAGGRVLYEESISAGVVAGAIDLKGDWWGLKSRADGNGPGIPVVIFGGEHQDLPLDETGGAALAEIVSDIRQPFIVDLEQLSKTKQLRFLAAFFERLYDVNREPIVLFCDEVDRYAPQKPMSPEANICLGAVEDIAKRGRSHGIFPKFITQRNASLNKNVSELCEVAIVYRTPGPRDQQAVEDWFATNATREELLVVKREMAGMATGTAIICSAHPQLRLFQTVALREPWTFDSSATPEIGKSVRKPKEMASADLEKLRTRMASTIERMNADNPKELRKQIVDLKKQLATKQTAVRAVLDQKSVDRAVAMGVKSFQSALVRKVRPLLGRGLNAIVGATNHLTNAKKEIEAAFDEIVTATQVPNGASPLDAQPMRDVAQPGQSVRRSVAQTERLKAVGSNPTVPPSEAHATGSIRKILTALAQHPGGLSYRQIGAFAGVSTKGGTFATWLSTCRTNGWIVGGKKEVVRITIEGLIALGDFDPLPTGRELADYWVREIGGTPARILAYLVDSYPEPRTPADIERDLAISIKGGTFATWLSTLRTRDLIAGSGKAGITASEIFFQ